MKLTKRNVEAIVPGEKDLYFWDDDLPGYGLRVKPSGVRSYIIQYRNQHGRSKRATLGRHGVLTQNEARKLAGLKLGSVRHGKDPVAEAQRTKHAPTMIGLCERYMLEHATPHKKASSAAHDQGNINRWILDQIGQMNVEAVTRADIQKLHHYMRRTPVAANRVFALLRKMFNLAEVWGLRPDGTNPCRHVQKYKEYKREKFLGPDELARFGKALNAAEKTGGEHPTNVAALRLLLFTGSRLSEVISFRWEQLDSDVGALRLPDSKTGAKTIHLGQPALDIIAGLPKVSDYILPAIRNSDLPLSKDTLESSWQRMRDRAKLTGFRLHDLRHTFASWAVMSGQSLPITGALLGHVTSQTTQRYAHLSDTSLSQAACSISDTILANMNRSHQ